MDELDRKILAALQKDGRLTNGEIGEAVGLSPSVCSRRRTILEKSGVISKYTAVIEPKQVKLNITALVSVSLSTHDDGNAERFAQLVNSLPNVLETFALTGEMDYHLKVVCHDLEDLSRFINRSLLPHESVSNVKTAIVLQSLKETVALPI